MAASEMAPFARTGALADGMAALPSALRQAGHDVRVVLPYYRTIRDGRDFSVRPTKIRFAVPVGEARYDCEIYEARAADGVQVFFIGRDEFFDRSGLYGSSGRDYQDNAARFIFFNKCVIELAKRLTPVPDILHAHDWQAALLPLLAKSQSLPWPVVLSVHDPAYQGNFWSYDFGLTNLPPDYFSARGLEFYGSMNFLKGGILFADRVVLPSELYVSEAQTREFGCGLDAVFRENAGKLAGIPDGVDVTQWDPASGRHLAAPYSAAGLGGKRACRDQLLAQFSLQANPKGPVFAMVSRLVQEKGLDILLPALDR
ncbi:MAG TPA: glycogen/starch synthase, partial [Chthoniobacterales bacterium]